MSEITGVKDFKDLYDSTEETLMKKLSIYIGYTNYLYSLPIDTTKFKTTKDWAKLFSFTIKAKSIYYSLNTGYVVLDDRDFFSLQEDKGLSKNQQRRINNLRTGYITYLMNEGYTQEEAEEIGRYKFELEVLDL